MLKNDVMEKKVSAEYAKMCKVIFQMSLSEYTKRKILDITNIEVEVGNPKSYQVLETITRILKSSISENEIQNKLREAFPKYN